MMMIVDKEYTKTICADRAADPGKTKQEIGVSIKCQREEIRYDASFAR